MNKDREDKYNFELADFHITVDSIAGLPVDTEREIAVIGRSNSGKSSLINTLTNKKRLAFTSKTPGRTQQINFFDIKNGNFLVDLPGYGYAQLSHDIQRHLSRLIGEYLSDRDSLIGLIIIMDIRRPFTELDYNIIDEFLSQEKPIHIVLSKSDKLSANQAKQTLSSVLKTVKHYVSHHIPVTVQTFSSLNKNGLDELQTLLTSWIS
jgi:GTP-binding protein